MLPCLIHLEFSMLPELQEDVETKGIASRTCSRQPLDQCPQLGEPQACPRPFDKPELYSTQKHPFSLSPCRINIMYRL